MNEREEMARLAREAADIIDEARRYLTEFGSVEPGLLVKRIDRWRDDIARSRTRAAGRDLQIGDRVPLEPRKLDIRPAYTGAGAPSFKPVRKDKPR